MNLCIQFMLSLMTKTMYMSIEIHPYNIVEPDKHSMSDVLSSNDLRILGLVLPQGHLDRLKLIGLNIEDKSPGELTKKKVADALKDIGQAHLAKVLSDKEGKMKFK